MIITLVNKLIDTIYKQNYLEKEEKLERLIRENSVLRGTTSNLLLFEGEFYFTKRSSGPLTDNLNCLLHPKLRNSFRKWLKDSESLFTEISMVRMYLNRVFSMKLTGEQFKELIPNSLHNTLDTVHICMPKSNKYSVSDENFAEFKVNNEKCLNMIKKRLALNLITN